MDKIPGSEFETLDSGQRREFPSGSVRDRAVGKGRFDLIPPEPVFALACLYERGAVKYGDRNWEKGQPLSSYTDSAGRHMEKMKAGWHDEDHVTAAIWNLFGYYTTLDRIYRGVLPIELDDRPDVMLTDEQLVKRKLIKEGLISSVLQKMKDPEQVPNALLAKVMQQGRLADQQEMYDSCKKEIPSEGAFCRSRSNVFAMVPERPDQEGPLGHKFEHPHAHPVPPECYGDFAVECQQRCQWTESCLEQANREIMKPVDLKPDDIQDALRYRKDQEQLDTTTQEFGPEAS